jgi:LysM repeat protein
MTEDSNVWLYGTLEQVSGAMAGENEIEIKAVAALDLIAFDKIREPIITDFTCEPVDKKEWSREPGIVGYVVQSGETMWDIAKRFFTTVESIMEINRRENENVSEGDVLLILKEVW